MEKQEEQYPHREVTEKIIGAAIEVHRILGPGYVEKIYERALAKEFRLREIDFENQVHVEVMFKNCKDGLRRFVL